MLTRVTSSVGSITSDLRRADLIGVLSVALGLILGLLLIQASSSIYGLESGMSDLTALLPLGYAFAAGMVATVNPCGALLLPSLVAFYLGQTGARPINAWQRAGRALAFGLIATLGFVVVFGAVGAVVASGGRALGAVFPVGGLAIGAGLALLGVWLALTGREVGLLAAGGAMSRVTLAPNIRSLFGFGVAYAVASLACTLPIFLVVVGSALAANGPVDAVLQFLSYAAGMGLVLTVVIVAAAFFQGVVARGIRRVVPHVHRVSAIFLLGAGIYLIDYWVGSGHALG